MTLRHLENKFHISNHLFLHYVHLLNRVLQLLVFLVDIYQTPANPAYEGKQKSMCFNYHSDIPSRHYYLQCPQLCQFVTCVSKTSSLHWGNTCPIFTQHLKSKRAFSAQYRKSMKDINILEQQSLHLFCDDNIESSMGKYDYVSGINHQVLHQFHLPSLIAVLILRLLMIDNF